jgi:hypothetical protein
MVSLLLRHGARLEERNTAGQTPLLAAAHAYMWQSARALLEARAAPNAVDEVRLLISSSRACLLTCSAG